LKARVRDPEASANVKPHHNKKRWITRNADGSMPWYPKDSWTAWPLRPAEVPRPYEKFGAPIYDGEDDGSDLTYRKKELWRRGAEMEEEILTVMLRLAKERFRKRQWQTSAPLTQATGSENERDPSHDEQTKRTIDPSSKESDMSMKEDSTGDEAETSDEEQAHSPTVRPTLLDDDEEAFDLLQPMIHHIISKLDDLLVGLHKSRKRRSRSVLRPRSRSRRQRSRSKSEPSPPVTGRAKRSRSAAQETDDDSDPESDDAFEEHNVTATKEDNNPKRPKPLNPRDWSEVLTIASLVGWDQSVVDRTAQRCAELFGERVDYRQTAKLRGPNEDDQTATVSAIAPASNPKVQDQDFIVDDNTRRLWLYCPVDDCKRKNEPFREAWRWREHLKRVHRYDKARIRRVEAAEREARETVGDNDT
jgi:hypothetical protein